jgi:hypothetical protein
VLFLANGRIFLADTAKLMLASGRILEGTVSAEEGPPTGTGSLEAQQATMSGAGDRILPGTGALPAQQATMAGVGDRILSGSGVLTAQQATMAGVAVIYIEGSGVLTAQQASMAGVGDRVLPGSGTLNAQQAVMSGAGDRILPGTGTLNAQQALMVGAGDRVLPGSGVLNAQQSTMSGDGSVTPVGENNGTGVLNAQQAQIAGVGDRVLTGSGALAAQQAAMLGAGDRVISNYLEILTDPEFDTDVANGGANDDYNFNGAVGINNGAIVGAGSTNYVSLKTLLTDVLYRFQYQITVIDLSFNSHNYDGVNLDEGVGIYDEMYRGNDTAASSILITNTCRVEYMRIDRVDELAAQQATMYGEGAIVSENEGDGALNAQQATMSGAGHQVLTGTGVLNGQQATVSGAGDRVITGTGSIVAVPATMAGVGVHWITDHLEMLDDPEMLVGDTSETGSGSSDWAWTTWQWEKSGESLIAQVQYQTAVLQVSATQGKWYRFEYEIQDTDIFILQLAGVQFSGTAPELDVGVHSVQVKSTGGDTVIWAGAGGNTTLPYFRMDEVSNLAANQATMYGTDAIPGTGGGGLITEARVGAAVPTIK